MENGVFHGNAQQKTNLGGEKKKKALRMIGEWEPIWTVRVENLDKKPWKVGLKR